MKKISLTFLVTLAVFVAMMSSATFLQNRNIQRWRQLPYRYRDTLYLPSSQYVKAVSLGYCQFTADFLWLRMIQSFAAGWSLPENAMQMKSYFEVVTDLDPKFVDVYNFAIMAIGEEGRHTAGFSKDPKAVPRIDEMVKGIIDKAIRKNPGSYETPYEGAFYAFWSLNDPALAKYYVRMAKKDPHYPDYIDRWEGFFDLKQGRYQAAYEKYLADYVHTIQAHNKELYPMMAALLQRAINDWFVHEIKQRAIDWQKQHGQYPSVEELDQAGAFKGVVLPDWTVINSVLLEPLLKGEMDANIDDGSLNKFIQGALHPWDHLPAGPYDGFGPKLKGFVIWRSYKPDQKNFVMTKVEALTEMKDMAVNFKTATTRYKAKKGSYPKDLAVYSPEIAKLTDPLGGNWIYDPQKGEINSTNYPEILSLSLPAVK